MIPDFQKHRIFIWTGSTDMRKSINGLSGLIVDMQKKNPYHGDIFLFIGKSRRNLKAIWWDRNGFCLWQKKLEKYRFPWPSSNSETWQISRHELKMLLKGIDFFHPHQEIKINF